MTNLDLLRRYEPVVRTTRGEMFYPCAVDGYLHMCRLWQAASERETTLLAEQGTITTQLLARFRDAPLDHRFYLQFVDEPLRALDYQRWLTRADRVRLPAPNRLERVSLATRILDGIFDLSLLVRGRVPGGTAAAAEQRCRAIAARDPRRVYYGRVVRTGGYIALHYCYFYAMNDWRSSFGGVNDHESDWEQVFVYLSDEGEAEPIPRWVAYASHDFSGDDLRRRWDDPEVQKVAGTHPVIHVGAGSHAGYFTRGEYMMDVEPAFLAPVQGVAAALDRLWTGVLRQSGGLGVEAAVTNLLSVPFVDYARGDGLAIGPGQGETWSPVLISDADGWVDGYRGLWGLDTWDPLGGERAPSGPKYNRDGTVRLSWRDPLAWAGLDKVLPPGQAVEAMTGLLAAYTQEEAELAAEIETQRVLVRNLELELSALRRTAYLGDLLHRSQQRLDAENAGLQTLSARLTDVAEAREASVEQLACLRAGDFGPPRAHIRHAHVAQPVTTSQARFTRLWAAVSGGLLILAVISLLYLRPAGWAFWLAGVMVAFGAIEAVTRRRVGRFLYGLVIALAIFNALILLFEFWAFVLVAAVVGLAALMIRDNLVDLRE